VYNLTPKIPQLYPNFWPQNYRNLTVTFGTMVVQWWCSFYPNVIPIVIIKEVLITFIKKGFPLNVTLYYYHFWHNAGITFA
jgi:hypothetical protein